MKLFATLNKSSTVVKEELDVIFNRECSVETTLVNLEILEKALKENNLELVTDVWKTDSIGLMNSQTQSLVTDYGKITIIKADNYCQVMAIYNNDNKIIYAIEGDEDYMEVYSPYLIEPDMVITSIK